MRQAMKVKLVKGRLKEIYKINCHPHVRTIWIQRISLKKFKNRPSQFKSSTPEKSSSLVLVFFLNLNFIKTSGKNDIMQEKGMTAQEKSYFLGGQINTNQLSFSVFTLPDKTRGCFVEKCCWQTQGSPSK